MFREEPVSFKNRADQELFGVAHLPLVSNDERVRKIGVIFLNPGPGYRIAHRRLYVRLARRLAQEGYYALRFDPAGIGESEGSVDEATLFNLFTSINKGRFINDVNDAADFFITRYGLEEIILIGLCGGAMTALLAAPYCRQKLTSLILLSFPVLFNSLEAEEKTALAPAYARDIVRGYLTNLMNFKVLSLSAWKSLVRNIKDRGLHRLLARLLEVLRQAVSKDSPSFLHPNFNKLFLDVLERVKKDIEINFIFGEYDRWKLYFEVEFEQKIAKKWAEKGYRKFIIKNENHLFTFQESQDELIGVILGLLPPTGKEVAQVLGAAKEGGQRVPAC